MVRRVRAIRELVMCALAKFKASDPTNNDVIRAKGFPCAKTFSLKGAITEMPTNLAPRGLA